MADINQGEDMPIWEKSFQKLLDPVEEFIHDEASTGLLLMGCAILANHNSSQI